MALLALTLAACGASAQTYTVTGITPVPNLGRVVSAPSGGGDTVFRIGSTSSLIQKVAGTGAGFRLDATTTRTLVTITCTNDNACPSAVTITVTAGAATKRARALKNFTVSANTGLVVGSITAGTGSISFPVTGIAKKGSGSFWLGADFGVGDDGSGTSGAATAAFTVATPTNSSSALAAVNVVRPVAIVEGSALSFGTILAPTTGSNTITLGTANNTATISGVGNGRLLGGATSRATYTITGESAQIVSISTPPTFPMTKVGGGTITVTLVKSAATATLTGTAGTAATAPLSVGGNFIVTNATAAGAYSGSFQVTVSHN